MKGNTQCKDRADLACHRSLMQYDIRAETNLALQSVGPSRIQSPISFYLFTSVGHFQLDGTTIVGRGEQMDVTIRKGTNPWTAVRPVAVRPG